MTAALYTGTVCHRRSTDVDHAFAYRLWLAYVDLDELPEALAFRPFAAARGPALLRLRRADLLGDPAQPPGDVVRDRVAASVGHRPTGPVLVLTALRSFGVGFNPVRFYYCFDARHAGVEELRAVVAEVTNTPWGERHAYVLTPDARGEWAGVIDKRMHVSPFLPMDHEYHWRIGVPGADLTVDLANHPIGAPDAKAFDATLRLRRRPLTRRTIAEVALRQPAQTLRIIAGIYGQAVRLKLKGAPYHAHPPR